MYQKAIADKIFFLKLTGIKKSLYQRLLVNFELQSPKSLTKEQKLFAILYANHHHLDAKKIGALLGYANAKRDGGKFLVAATSALALSKVVIEQSKSEPAQVLPYDSASAKAVPKKILRKKNII